jgi:pilus assembly protein FimV
LLALGGVGFVLYRRKKTPLGEEIGQSQELGEQTGHFVTPVMPSPDTGDFTATVVQPVTAPPSETVDPISEADLFLNFGRDAQAEEILKEALQNTPNNHQIHLKLLGIYANRKDANSFSAIAQQLKDSGDDGAWQQAVEMGRKLEPNNPTYGGFRSMEDTGSATVQMTAFKATPEPEAPKAASALDFDFDVSASTQSTPSSAASSEMDFDITSSNPAKSEPSAPTETPPSTSDDLIFDVTGGHAAAAQPEVSPAVADSGGMAFTLNFPVEEAPKAAPAASAAIGLDGINLNFDEGAAPSGSSGAENKDDHWQEVATKLDLAKAYMEMGDNDGAREILNEVLSEGDAEQQATAQTLFAQIG